ncbi:MAG: hypothetical protein JWN49_468 [Parcubacteria group bacterium]|nr:hypothetical protein [Parcubacteria group bacterium]
MTRSRFLSYLSLGTLSAVGLLVPGATHAAGVVGVFSPIIDQSGICLCTGMAPSWGCVLQTIQNAVNVGISVGVVICVLYMAYAGVLFMMSSANPGLREQGKTRLMNGVIGMVVVLGAWVAVDFVMKALYDPSTAFSGTNFGPWNSILASNGDDYCIRPHDPTALTSGSISIVSGVAQSPGAGAPASGSGTGACNAQQVAAAAAQGGYQLTGGQANALACIAGPESGCGAKTTGATTPQGKPTSASGPWQITIGATDKCHSLTLPACGNLNCSAAYSHGSPKSDQTSQALAAKCQAAANNLACSASAAACLIQANGGKFNAWTADSRSGKQQTCITSNGQSF